MTDRSDLRPSGRRVPRAAALAQRIGPWLIAVVVIVMLARKYDPAEVARNMKEGAWHLALPFGLAMPFAYLVLHGLWDTVVLKRALGGPRYLEVLRGRAGTAMLMLAGYFFGHTAFGIWLARKTGARASAVSAVVLYTMMSDLASVGVAACIALALGRPDVPTTMRTIAIAVTVVPLSLAIAGPHIFRRTTAAALAPWRRVPSGVAVMQIGGRSLDVGLAVVVSFLASRAFGLVIPLPVFAAYMPLILLASSLPVSVAGFGAAQLVWLVFLPWAPAEKVLAFQLVWQLSVGAGLTLRGLPFVRGVMRDVRAGTAKLAAAQAASADERDREREGDA